MNYFYLIVVFNISWYFVNLVYNVNTIVLELMCHDISLQCYFSIIYILI